MFIDEAEITVKGGNGGNGKVAFFANRKGVSGGNGGNGGYAYAKPSSNVTDLKRYTEIIDFKAQDGQAGGSNKRIGVRGNDLVLHMPIGTTIIDSKTSSEITLTKEDSKILICRGGTGGLGNAAFRTATNRTPKTAEPGKPGQVRNIRLILKLIADYGLIGLPNAGKSSLLNILTRANVKTANYPFTTLEPNLGVFEDKVIADVPGLIEGAAGGKGLGIKFLKHIEKVNLLFHCITCESTDLEKDFTTVIKELSNYNKSLLAKKSVILLTKVDLLSPTEIEEKVLFLQQFSKTVYPVSIYDPSSLALFKKIISSL